jgi:3-methyladenine DNA glycosylase Tag
MCPPFAFFLTDPLCCRVRFEAKKRPAGEPGGLEALPRDYGMWLRVRERGKLRAIEERAADVLEVQISPEEFGAYCKGLKASTIWRQCRRSKLPTKSGAASCPATKAQWSAVTRLTGDGTDECDHLRLAQRRSR